MYTEYVSLKVLNEFFPLIEFSMPKSRFKVTQQLAVTFDFSQKKYRYDEEHLYAPLQFKIEVGEPFSVVVNLVYYLGQFSGDDCTHSRLLDLKTTSDFLCLEEVVFHIAAGSSIFFCTISLFLANFGTHMTNSVCVTGMKI